MLHASANAVRVSSGAALQDLSDERQIVLRFDHLTDKNVSITPNKMYIVFTKAFTRTT